MKATLLNAYGWFHHLFDLPNPFIKYPDGQCNQQQR